MSKNAAARLPCSTETTPYSTYSTADIVAYGRDVVAAEAAAVAQIAERLDDEFAAAVRQILQTLGDAGDVIVAGMGKAGLIGQKLAATFASTGTRAHFLHPAEAFHGDLGRVRSSDLVLMLSQSGETSEVLQLLPALRHRGTAIVAVTATAESTLGQAARVVLPLGRLQEACSLGLAPSTSTTAMLALGDALALTVSRLRGFRDEDFARIHPGGALGLKLSLVEAHMRPLSECRLADEGQTVREVLVASTKPGRRSGAVILTDAAGQLTGLFTDSDLARLIEHRDDAELDRPICEHMAKSPTTVSLGERMSSAIELLTERKFSELPVVDAQGRPVGLIDVTDVLGLGPAVDDRAAESARAWDDFARPTVRIFSAEEPLATLPDASRDIELPETD